MASDRFARIESLYHAALSQSPDERAAFLADACAGDEALRREVESLLAEPTAGSHILNSPALAGADRHATRSGGSLLGRRLGPYDITASLGAGGMGEVYRAQDVRLRRDVALKVLPATVTDDSGRLARFEREARMLAALSHPNIGAIFGLETLDGVPVLVLELIQGDTLADRLALGPLPVPMALNFARQVASALDEAHEKGIVHRDLKPANIKITPDGVVKVLDFGLAKVTAPVGDSTVQPTLTFEGTTPGVIMGTAKYMSPEQARGQTVDKRTDIWAFGCVFYEMLTGRKAFAGPTVTDTLAAVLEREPNWSALPPATSSQVRTLLARCLDKDPKRRLRDVADALHDLSMTGDEAPGAPTTDVTSTIVRGRRALRPLLIGTVAALALSALIPFAIWRVSAPLEHDGQLSLSGTLTPATADDGISAEPALSDDGSLLAFASDRAGHGDLDIWVQQTAGRVPLQLTHDDVDEHEPSFSPDGGRIVYRSERDGGGVYVTAAFGGGTPRFLAEGGRRPRFSPDGTKVAYWTGANYGFAAVANGYRTFVVSVDGGAAREITGFTAARYPVWSPDGKALLVQGSRSPQPKLDTFDWWLVPLDGSAAVPLGIAALFEARGMPITPPRSRVAPEAWSGDRVYWSDGFLWSARLDRATHSLAGIERLTFGTMEDRQISVSRDGRVAFASLSEGNSIFALPLDVEQGKVIGEAHRLTPRTSTYSRPSATPSGDAIAYLAGRAAPGILFEDLRSRKVIDLGVTASAFGPAVSPDGTLVAFERDGAVSIVPTKGGAASQVCLDCQVGDWTEDGANLIVAGDGEHEIARIEVPSLRRHTLVRGPRLARPFLAPGERLLAFGSTETDPSGGLVGGIAVAPMNEDVTPESAWVRVTTNRGGERSCGWSPSGELLYFVSARDGARCLYAQRVNRTTGQPIGPAFAVQHFHGTRNLSGGEGGILSTGPANAIRGGQFFYDLGEQHSNVWVLSRATDSPK